MGALRGGTYDFFKLITLCIATLGYPEFDRYRDRSKTNTPICGDFSPPLCTNST